MIQLQFLLFLSTDQCVDKAKVDESEQKAAEFSKKVSHRSHGRPSWSGLSSPDLRDKLSIFHDLINVCLWSYMIPISITRSWCLLATPGGALLCSFDSKLHFKQVDDAVLSVARGPVNVNKPPIHFYFYIYWSGQVSLALFLPVLESNLQFLPFLVIPATTAK